MIITWFMKEEKDHRGFTQGSSIGTTYSTTWYTDKPEISRLYGLSSISLALNAHNANLSR